MFLIFLDFGVLRFRTYIKGYSEKRNQLKGTRLEYMYPSVSIPVLPLHS